MGGSARAWTARLARAARSAAADDDDDDEEGLAATRRRLLLRPWWNSDMDPVREQWLVAPASEPAPAAAPAPASEPASAAAPARVSESESASSGGCGLAQLLVLLVLFGACC